jgi:hypothetical protein
MDNTSSNLKKENLKNYIKNLSRRDGNFWDGHSFARKYLNDTFGADWVENILQNNTLADYFKADLFFDSVFNLDHKSDSYLTDFENIATSWVTNNFETNLLRITNFAELLFNLSDIENFDTQIQLIREGHIEPTLPNLYSAKLLFLSNIQFKFVKPQGKTGFDYDLEITTENGQQLCLEAKVKLENKPFNTKTITNTLEGARHQLPNNYPGIIFIYIPFDWFNQKDLISNLERITGKFLRNTSRVCSVVYFTENLSFDIGAIDNRAFLTFEMASKRTGRLPGVGQPSWGDYPRARRSRLRKPGRPARRVERSVSFR